VGYTCDGGFTSPPLYGSDPERVAPCLLQSSEGVVWTIRVFLFGLSSVLFVFAIAGAKWYPITAKNHQMVLEATEQLLKGSENVTDPLTHETIQLRTDTARSLRREHFSRGELASRGTLVPKVSLRLCLWAGALVALLVAMSSTTGQSQQYLVSVGSICCAAIFVLLPWDAIRLKVALALGSEDTRVQDDAPVSEPQPH